MSKELDALGRSLHHVGVNVDRTTLGVAIRELEGRGYHIVPVSSPRFHVQPMPADGQVTSVEAGAGRIIGGGGADPSSRKADVMVEKRAWPGGGGGRGAEISTKGGSGRV